MVFPSGIQILNRLGLTVRQAKAYLSLAGCGVSSVKQISKASDVPREDLYKILNKLNKMGLVEKKITFPVTYEAIPIHDALSFLHKRRIKETKVLQVDEKQFLEKFMKNFAPKVPRNKESQFALIPKKDAVIRRIKKSIDETKYAIDVVNSLRRHLRSALIFGTEVNQALDRGVKIRVITKKPEDEKLLPEVQKDLQVKPGFEVKYIPTDPSTNVTIFDKKEVLIVVDESADFIKSSTLRSNNRNLVLLAQNYFDVLWQK